MDANNHKNKLIQQYRKIVSCIYQNQKLDSIKCTLIAKESLLKEAKLKADDEEEKLNEANLLKMKLAMDITTYNNIRKRLVPEEEFTLTKIEKQSKLVKIEQELQLIKSHIPIEENRDIENQTVQNSKHLAEINEITNELKNRKVVIKHQMMAMVLLFSALIYVIAVYH